MSLILMKIANIKVEFSKNKNKKFYCQKEWIAGLIILIIASTFNYSKYFFQLIIDFHPIFKFLFCFLFYWVTNIYFALIVALTLGSILLIASTACVTIIFNAILSPLMLGESFKIYPDLITIIFLSCGCTLAAT